MYTDNINALFCCLIRRSNPSLLREQLKEVLDAEQAGLLNPSLRLKKKALQHAYDAAIKKKMVPTTIMNVPIYIAYVFI